MKEIIQGKLSKILITFITLVCAFLEITFIGYIIEIELLKDMSYSYLDYLLYLLGYGSIDDSNIWFKVIFSISSLFVLTLFSSACTVTWLESRRTLKISDKIQITQNSDGDFCANVCLKSRKQSIYNAQVTAIMNIGIESYVEEVNIAYIPKKSYRLAAFNVGLNSVLYRHFKEILEGRSDGAELVLAVKYSDVLSGEEYTVFKKYTHNCDINKSDFIFTSTNEYFEKCVLNNEDALKKSFESFISSKQFSLNLENAQIIDSRSPERYKMQPQNRFCVEFSKEKSYNDGDFQMLCVPIDISDDWGVYYDMGGHIYIELDEINDIDVFIEIKKDDGREVILAENNKLSRENRILDVDMTRYRRHTWENMKEVCFTVFYSHVRDENKKAEFTIKDCSFHI